MDDKIKVIHKSIFEIRFPDGTSKTLSAEQAYQLYDALAHHVGPEPQEQQASKESKEKATEDPVGQAQRRRRTITRLLPEVPF